MENKKQMMRYRLLILIVLGLFSSGLYAQNAKKYVRKGNKQFEKGEFSDAEVQYRKALDKDPNSFKGKFNLGDAMYKQDNYEESGKLFNELSAANLTPEVRAKSFYNLGNTLMKAKKYKESIDAFKQSLKLDPDNYNAKYNLEYARKKLKEQQQKQQQQKQNKDKNKEKNKKQNKEKNKQDQKNKDKEKQKQDQNKKQDQQKDQNKQDQQKQQNKQQQQQQKQQISKKDAARMLQALKNDEKKTLHKLEKQKAKAAKSSKSVIDW
ncbi:MAG: tetratricopeptide repeat protein [Chlorobi bacterium]|nr:tetratricopeptide repeat protein [Chlorobiota bacterium]